MIAPQRTFAGDLLSIVIVPLFVSLYVGGFVHAIDVTFAVTAYSVPGGTGITE